MEPDRDVTLTTRKRNEFVLNALRRRFGADPVASSGVSVLDVGCGGGGLADPLGRLPCLGRAPAARRPRARERARRAPLRPRAAPGARRGGRLPHRVLGPLEPPLRGLPVLALALPPGTVRLHRAPRPEARRPAPALSRERLVPVAHPPR